MRTLKKSLSLVLVLAMVCSFFVMGTSAAFEDDDKITAKYAEAIEVMNGLKILQGSDGKFDPQGTLTRAQAARIIVAMTGSEELAKTAVCTFTDVATTDWFYDEIAYCQSKGYMKGYGDGTVGPNDELTGPAFALMLMKVIGIDTSSVNPATYALDTVALAVANELATVAELTAEPFTREIASGVAYEGLQYGAAGQGYTVAGLGTVVFTDYATALTAALSMGGDAADITPVAAQDSLYTTVFAASSVSGIVESSPANVAGQKYSEVDGVKFDYAFGAEMLGRYVTVYYKVDATKAATGYEVYSVIDKTTEVPVTAATKDTELKAALAAVGVTANVAANYNTIKDGVIAADGTAITLGTTKGSDLGACTLYVYNKAVVGAKFADTYQIGKVSAYTAPTAQADGSITITNVTATGAFGAAASITLKDLADTTTVDPVVLYEGIKANDIVYLQKFGTNPMVVTKATLVEGVAVESFTDATVDTMVVGGKTYTASAITDNSGISDVAAGNVGTTKITLVLDKAGAVAGYIAYVAPDTSAAKDYAMVLAIDYKAGEIAKVENGYVPTYGKVTAYLLLADGTKATYTYTSTTKTSAGDLETEFGTFTNGDVMKYAVANGVFTEIPSKYTETKTNAVITAKSAITGETGYYYTTTTPFVYMDTTPGTVATKTAKVITGYATTEAAAKDEIVVVTDDTAKSVIVVFVQNAYVGTPVAESNIAVVTAPVTSTSYSTVKYDATLKDNVYAYDFYVDGVKTTFWAKEATLASLTANAGYITYTITDGYLSAVSNTITGYTAVSGTVNFLDASAIVLGSTQCVYNSSAKLVTYDTSDAALTAGGTLAVEAVVTYALKNTTTGAIDYAFITVA